MPLQARPGEMLIRLALLLLLGGCVVQYGQPPEGVVLPPEMLPPPVDFTEAVARIDALLDGEVDVDRLDRLLAARDLARRMKRADTQSQQDVLAYLQMVIAVEERAQPVDSPVVYDDEVIASFTPMAAPIVEESLDSPGDVPPTAEAGEAASVAVEPGGSASQQSEVKPTAAVAAVTPVSTSGAVLAAGVVLDVDAMRNQALADMDDGRPQDAMATLAVCRGLPCWQRVGDLWGLARDAHVFAERERAGELFLRARGEKDADLRIAALVAVRQQLSDLVTTYPESRYAPAIRRNVRLVERELAALKGASSASR